ncbi:MAG TPA: hypothetical protein VGQ76_01150 [Thermoanaerobaculia bacterium]|jgi:probable HAF family extracellular repeat protein|nr:hypothetical protein [Thermoanaerobaculia bacterium]
MTRFSLSGAALLAIILSVSPVLFAQVSSYTVTELGTLDNGGNVTGNQHVVHWFEVPEITTSKIRVLVNDGKASHSRIVEVEAWDGWASTSNVALASQGATATASSIHNAAHLPAAAINGDRKGIHWGSDPNTGSGWVDGTPDSFPDWLQVNFSENRNLTKIYVYTVQDDLSSPVDPSHLLQFQKYGITDFQVQYWNGSAWVDLANVAESRAFKFNDAGVVVGDSGYAAGPSNKLPFRWQNGVMAALGGFVGSARWVEGSASSINNAGVIAGSSRNPTTGQQTPYQWTAGTFLDLGALGTTGTWAHDINDAAPVQIVGAAETDPKSLKTRAWIWSNPTGKALIPLLPGGTSNSATAINNLGHVVGFSNTTSSEQHAFRMVGSTVTDLGTLGGPWSTAQDINDAGLIVGASRIDASTPGQPRHAFSYSTDGGMVDLGTLGGGIHSWAFGVNNAGVIVGNAYTSSGAERAFVYDSVNGMRDLNALTSGSGWSLNVARSINSGGQIVGWGLNPAGIRRAFLLTPNAN